MLSIVNDHNYQINWLRKYLLRIFKLTKTKILKPEQKNISVGLSFSNKEEIQQLNKKYRNKDFPTDVFSKAEEILNGCPGKSMGKFCNS